MIEGSGSCGYGSSRPKNRRIRIRNTATFQSKKLFSDLLFLPAQDGKEGCEMSEKSSTEGNGVAPMDIADTDPPPPSN